MTNLLLMSDVFGIKNFFFHLFYNIFVEGPLYIVHGIGNAITYLSGQKIIDLVFDTHGHFFGMPKAFILFLAVGVMLIVLLGAITIIHAMVHKNVGGAVAGVANRLVIVLLLMALIPLFFWVASFTVTSIIHIVFPGMNDGRALADMVGRLGWADGGSHMDWHYTDVPDYNDGYNLFLGTFGALFSVVIFFLMGMALIKRVFDLFLLYVASPIVFATAVSGQKWQKVALWKDLAIARFIGTLGIVLALTLFLNLEPKMITAAHDVGTEWFTRTAFSLLFIAGGAIAVYQSQSIFSAMAGATVGIQDGLSMLVSTKAAGLAGKAGVLGMLGVGRGFLMGRNRKRWGNNPSGFSLGESIRAKPVPPRLLSVPGLARIATKATVGAALTSAGYIAGAKRSFQAHGAVGTAKLAGKAAKTPATKISKALKTKTTAAYNKGLNVHKQVVNKSDARLLEQLRKGKA